MITTPRRLGNNGGKKSSQLKRKPLKARQVSYASNATTPKKDPLERAMEILEEYDKGTPPYQRGVDHWGE